MDFNDSGNDTLVFESESMNSERVFATILLAILQLLITVDNSQLSHPG